jgi:hypothetical protein
MVSYFCTIKLKTESSLALESSYNQTREILG